MPCSKCKQKGHNIRTCKKVNINSENKINIQRKKPNNIKMRTESQAHGLIFEDYVKKHIYGCTENVPYTNEIDIPSNSNNLSVNISIKTTGNENLVCLADAKNFYDKLQEEPLYMCVIVYEQKENSKILKKIIEIDLSNSKKILFGSLTRTQIEELDKLIKCIPKGKVSTTDRKKIHDLKKELNKFSGYVCLNPKVDSKGQRRLQCSFNKFKKFIQENPQMINLESNNGKFRGGEIPEEIVSPPRKRNTKNPSIVSSE